MSVGWVAENKGAVRLVDVREHDEAESDGMIHGVDVVPMGTVDEASKAWDKEIPVITICRSGRRSGRVALELEKLGFKRIASMRGGMVAWNNQTHRSALSRGLHGRPARRIVRLDRVFTQQIALEMWEAVVSPEELAIHD